MWQLMNRATGDLVGCGGDRYLSERLAVTVTWLVDLLLHVHDIKHAVPHVRRDKLGVQSLLLVIVKPC